MVKKLFLFILLLYLLTLLQTSFFPHFSLGHWLNFVLIVVILINLFEAEKEKLGIMAAFLAGFFLDIFSETFFGFWVLILLAIVFFIKLILRKHVRIPIFHPVRN